MTTEGVATPTLANAGYRSNPRPEMLHFLPTLKKGAKVLEVGCGEGAFAAAIEPVVEAWGIEPYVPSAAIASKRLFKVFAGTFDAIRPELPHRYFDVVICNDVIEHMTDHDAFLDAIQAHMVAGGTLVGSIPNIRHYKSLFDLVIARDWDYRDSGVLDRTHFRFFTIKSIRRSLQRAGFRVERLEGINGAIHHDWDAWALARNAFAYALIALSAGRASDVRYLQLAFRAVLPAPADHISGPNR
jgi:2-polyprenyl-3-methyl-5-hydroxy-6-metoxy-1,4-benzoquinol methylase